VRGDLRSVLRLLVLPTVVIALVAAFFPGRLEQGVRIYALLICASALGVAVASLIASFPPAGRLRRSPAGGDRPRESVRSLAQLENVMALGAEDARDLHFRLRPRVRALAAELLQSRRGIVLDDQPEAARALLGDEAWELVRSDRTEPVGEHAPGLSRAALERVVVSLERL
jgi:Cys-tRNA synthase (O-phospho-L-seryl-tRNA:Cys-tRNA synthase)